MKIFLDTSALYAFLDGDDANHNRVVRAWDQLAKVNGRFVATNYVLLETFVLVQHRLGLAAVGEFAQNLVPLLEIEWVSPELHSAAAESVLAAGRRDLSLVDCVSFATMRRLFLQKALTLDSHFREQGFECLP
jgi:uncharacterized protein